ncbi:MAG: glycerol-3-phosphate 1-O-acyltransferase PlsY [Oscillospiraceae bacterium]|nr:glycerol-3-phosphate 1-O-acyltransferase PlsY [Oscillospiraceae bacterium]
MLPPQTWLLLAGICIAAYLIGSVNFAVIVSRIAAKDDIRRHGSGSAGMTNMLRTYGKGLAAVTFLGDFLKAVGAVILVRLLGVNLPGFEADAGYLAGIFVIIGHLFPLYFRFKGGKGVASSLGVIMMVNPGIFAIVLLCSLPLIFITRIISLASVSGAILFIVINCTQVFIYPGNSWYYSICAVIIGAIILYAHRENIKRLHNGTENRLGMKKT